MRKNIELKFVGFFGLILVLMLTGTAMGDVSRAGLVAEYYFDGDANDSSGNGNNGTINGATFVSGISGQALSFDGVDDYVEIINDPSFDSISSSNAITITALFRFNINPYTLTQDRAYIIDRALDWRLWYSPTSHPTSYPSEDQFFWDIWDWQGPVTQNIIWENNKWYFIATTYNGTIGRVYINSELNREDSTIKSLNNNPSKITIGSGNEINTFFNGIIDEVRIYNRSLSEEEIKESYFALAIPTNSVGYNAVVAAGQNTIVESSDGSFGPLMKGETKTISNSVILNNTGDLSAKVEARFNDSIGSVYGLVNGTNLLNASNFSLGPSGALVPLLDSGDNVLVATAPPGVTALDARLEVPSDAVAGDYTGTVVLTFSNNV